MLVQIYPNGFTVYSNLHPMVSALDFCNQEPILLCHHFFVTESQAGLQEQAWKGHGKG